MEELKNIRRLMGVVGIGMFGFFMGYNFDWSGLIGSVGIALIYLSSLE